MLIPPPGSSFNGIVPPIPGENTSTPLQQIKPVIETLPDSSINSIIAVMTTAYSDKKNYEGEADLPKLPLPSDGKSSSPIQPAAQNVVTGFIAKEITMLLQEVSSPENQKDLFNHLTQGTPLNNPELVSKAAEIQSQVEKKVKAETKLENFTLSALYQPNKEAWIQTPLKPYSEDERKGIEAEFQQTRIDVLQTRMAADPAFANSEEATLLKAAIEGKAVDPRVKYSFETLNAQTTQVIQEKYGLPISWVSGTTDMDKWKAVNKGILNVKAVAEARRDLISNNNDTLSINYLSVIIDALYNLKEILSEKLLLQMELTARNTNFKLTDIQVRADITAKNAEDYNKSLNRQNNLAIFSKVAMVVGAVVSLVSLVATIASAGLLSPLALAAIAVTGLMLTYTVVDSVTGITSKTFNKLNELFSEMTSGLPDAVAAALKVIAIVYAVAIVAVVVILTAPTGGTAVTGMATQKLTTAVVAQAARLAARQLAVQLTLIIVMSSGVLLEFPSEMLKLTGLDESNQQMLKMLIFIMEMVAVMIIATKATSSINKAPTAAGEIPVKQLGMVDKAKSTLDQVKKQLITSLETAQEALNKAYGTLKSPERILSAFGSVGSGVKNTATNALGGIVGNLKTVATSHTSPAEKQARLQALDTLLKMTSVMTTVTTSAVESVYQGLIYQITVELGENEKAEAQIKALIAFIDDMIRALQASPESDIISEVIRSINTLMRSSRAASSQIFNSYQG